MGESMLVGTRVKTSRLTDTNTARVPASPNCKQNRKVSNDRYGEIIDGLQDPGLQDHAHTAAEVGECPLTGERDDSHSNETSHDGVLMICQS